MRYMRNCVPQPTSTSSRPRQQYSRKEFGKIFDIAYKNIKWFQLAWNGAQLWAFKYVSLDSVNSGII